MPGLWPQVEAGAVGRSPQMLDRETARALVEARYMKLADYIALFESSCVQRRPMPLPAARTRRTLRRMHLLAPKALRRLTIKRRA